MTRAGTVSTTTATVVEAMIEIALTREAIPGGMTRPHVGSGSDEGALRSLSLPKPRTVSP